jgi:acetyltransferase-like isoleucine patch superfamily enzyme
MEFIKNFFKEFYKRQLSPNAYAKYVGVNFGKNCNFRTKKFGSEPYLINMGDNVRTSGNVSFITHAGGLSIIRCLYPEYKDIDLFEPINIGNNVFLGYGVTVLPGAEIGDNVIVGANSVVTKKKLKDNSIYAGVPAKYICSLDEFMAKNKSKFVYTHNLAPAEKERYLKEKFSK